MQPTSQQLLDKLFPVEKDEQGNILSIYQDGAKGVVFENRKLVNLDFKQADISGAIFKNCFLSEVDMGDCDLADVIFENCEIKGLKAYGILAVRTKFINCILDDCMFARALFKDAEFNTCEISGCTFFNSNFKSAKFDNVSWELCGFLEAEWEDLQGLELLYDVDSRGNRIVYDKTNDRVFHVRFGGNYRDVIDKLVEFNKFMPNPYRRELLSKVKKLKGDVW